MSKVSKEVNTEFDDEVARKYQLIGEAICEDLPDDASNGDVVKAFTTSQGALSQAVIADIRANCAVGFMNPKRESGLLAMAAFMDRAKMRAVKEGLSKLIKDAR